MSFPLIIMCWYIVGLVGCAIGVYVDMKLGEDFKVSDLLLTLFISLFGVVPLLLGVGYWFSKNKVADIVLIKNKRWK